MYQIIKDLQKKGKLKELVNLGVIPLTVPRNLKLYEAYLKERTTVKSIEQAIVNVCDSMGSNRTSLRKVIRKYSQ